MKTWISSRPRSTFDILCGFIDTDFNQERFFVRRVDLPGAGAPYDKIRPALKADMDEAT